MIFFPGTPVNLKNFNKHYTEVPTIPSTTSKIGRALDKLDLEAVQKKLESALDGIAELTTNPDLATSIGHLKETLRDARKLVNRVVRSGGSAGARHETDRQRYRQAGP